MGNPKTKHNGKRMEGQTNDPRAMTRSSGKPSWPGNIQNRRKKNLQMGGKLGGVGEVRKTSLIDRGHDMGPGKHGLCKKRL